MTDISVDFVQSY